MAKVAIFEEDAKSPMVETELDTLPEIGSWLTVIIDIGGKPLEYRGKVTDVEYEIVNDHGKTSSRIMVFGKFKPSD